MRISTSQMYYTGTQNILNVQADLYKTQNQLSTGRKILTPRDNPVDATLALMTNQSKEVNASFMKNQAMAKDQLALIDSQLGSVVDLMQNVLERAIQGGNGTLGPQEKQAIGQEMRQRFSSLVDLANSKDGNGEAIFAGNRTNITPFTDLGANTGSYSLASGSVSYGGDDGQRLLQVEASQIVPTSESGQEVFMRVRDSAGNLLGKSVFDTVRNMIDSIDSSGGAASAQTYSASLSDLKTSLDHILRIRADVGANMNQIASLTNTGEDLAVQYETRLANLEGLDYTSAISSLMQQKTQLEASQQSFVKTSQLNLFQFIS